VDRFRIGQLLYLLAVFLGGMQTGFNLLEIADRGTGFFKLALSLIFSALMAWQLWKSIVQPQAPKRTD
jgi:hypothetical protein